MRGVLSSPQGAVDKMFPDRTVSGEYRFINDMRLTNSHCVKEGRPPAGQPQHRQLARMILWWKARHPLVQVLLAKKDVKAALKRIWVSADSSVVMAVELLGSHWDLEFDVAEVFLVLVFGFMGAPGQYIVWGWGMQQFHEHHKPEWPEVHEDMPFTSKFLMDDTVLAEPALGLRPWVSEACMLQGMTKLLGEGSLNQQNDDLEGGFDVKALIWGLDYDTTEGTVAIPEPKLLKGSYLLSQPCFDAGETGVPLLEVQKLHGTWQYYQVVQPSLRPEMGAISALLRQTDPGSQLVCPPGSPQERQETFQEFWDTVEMGRVFVARPET